MAISLIAQCASSVCIAIENCTLDGRNFCIDKIATNQPVVQKEVQRQFAELQF